MQIIIPFFAFYFMLLLATAIFINGFFAATRGEIIIQPDGTKLKTGKALRQWSFYWLQEVNKKKMYFKGNQLADKFHDIFGDKVLSPAFSDDKVFLTQFGVFDLRTLEKRFNVKIVKKKVTEGYEITIYREDPVYRFPWWVRDMMAGCITCHPTIYGNLVFWLCHLTMQKDFMFNELYGWAVYPVVGLLFTWLAFWASLAWVCPVLWKKMN